MSTTLLEYLTSPNPTLDCTQSSTGPNSVNAQWDLVTGLRGWTEFNYDTIMNMYGTVLQQQIASIPAPSPPLSTLDRQIFTERTFDGVLYRTVMPEVSTALRIAWPLCYPNDSPDEIVEIAIGDKAKRRGGDPDPRLYPDWAGIRKSKTTDIGYQNLCPGETKLASKWGTAEKFRARPDFNYPLNQVQTYCGRQWACRYGYIITPEELVVVRVSREFVGPGLAALRPRREATGNPSSHSRNFSVDTMSSGLQAMSLDTGSAFSDGPNPDIEYQDLLLKTIPWSARGTNVLTVKLALWFLHMETRNDLSVQTSYPPLQRALNLRPEKQQQPGSHRDTKGKGKGKSGDTKGKGRRW
ncbi:hypothetical protein DV738_g4764, partial [Chaetothyriales sp. CBS 135597]